MSYTRFKGKLSPVMDLDYDLSCSFHTPDTLREKFRLLRKCGFTRISIVVPPPDDVDYTHAAHINFIPAKDNNHLAASRRQFANPMKQAVALAKEAGLEVHAIFKPYEGGGFFTVPAGHHLATPRPQVDCLGGSTGVTSFIAKHPDWRLKRRECERDDANLPVTRIEVAFLLDALGQPKVPAIPDQALRRAAQWQPRLYVSDDNAGYARLGTEPVIQREIRTLRIVDANGFPVLSAARCLVVTLTGFEIRSRFMAVAFEGGKHRLLLIPYSMIRAMNGRRVLDVSISPTYRYWPCQTREFRRKPPTPADFRTCGFEFAVCCTTGWRDWPVFGIARGHEPYLRGVLCEAVPGVRAHWLDQVKTLIGYGCDGVDIRLLSHCSGIEDFANYGYNDEIVKVFEDRLGRLPGRSKTDFLTLMRIRGEFFVRFLEDARTLLHARGRTLQVHLRDCLCKPSLGSAYHENGFWAMPKILPDWREIVELVDTVILSDNLCAGHFSGTRKTVELPIKRYASKVGKPVWVYCYLQQGHSFNRETLADYAKDPHVSGVYLYEVVYNKREDDGLLEVLAPDKVRVVPKHRALLKELLKT